MEPNPNLILPVGTQVVARVPIHGDSGKVLCPTGAVGVVVRAPLDNLHSYRVRLPDGAEVAMRRHELAIRKERQREGLELPEAVLDEYDLFGCVIYRCVMGSRAYGLDLPESDTDRRGIYLPPADLQWSLYGVPEQIENPETQECYWELQKFLVLALKANPNVLECLYSPIVESATPLARELVEIRACFLSRLIHTTFNGYVLSQFKKLQADVRSKGEPKWKHVMHLLRILLAGVAALREGVLPVRVEAHRDRLLAIRRGEVRWDDVEAWRLELHREFEASLASSPLPERPDYPKANAFLLEARRRRAGGNDLP